MTAAAGSPDELGKLLAAAEQWLRGAGGAGGMTAGPEDPAQVRDLFPPAAGHRSDAPCEICPFCQLISAVRAVRPEVVDHLTDAANSLVLAFRAVTAPTPQEPQPDPPAPASPPVVQHIPIN